MLEEVQMPPRLVLRVVNRTTLASALSAGEPAPAWKIHVQIEPTILDRKLATRHHPRRLQPKGQLEKIGVSHPLRLNSTPPQRSPTRPQIPTYPLLSARSRCIDARRRPFQEADRHLAVFVKIRPDARLELHLTDDRKNKNRLEIGVEHPRNVGEMLHKKLNEIILENKVVVAIERPGESAVRRPRRPLLVL